MRSIFRLPEGFLSLLSLYLLMMSVVWSVQAARWVDYLFILTPLALAALFCGLVFSRLPLPVFVLDVFSLIVGGSLVLFLVTGALPKGEFEDKALMLWDRFVAWAEVTVGGGIATDNLLFLVLLAALVWLIGYTSAWSVFRAHSPWVPVIASGAALIIHLSYARDLVNYLLVYLAAALALVVRLNICRREESWQRDGLAYEPDVRGNLLGSGLLIGGGLLALTWLAPFGSLGADKLMASLNDYTRPWRHVESEFSRMFGGVTSRPGSPTASRPTTVSGFSTVMALRGATNLGPTEVLEVDSPRAAYWRGVTYEKYTGRGWLMGETTAVDLPKDDLRFMDSTQEYKLREYITQTVRILQPRGDIVVAAAEPRRFEFPVRAELIRGIPPEENNIDLNVVRSSAAMQRGNSYTVVSSVSVADATSLRKAGDEYPTWVTGRFLQLSKDMPQRVAKLAQNVVQTPQPRYNEKTASMETVVPDNPYDKAKAIESYLRANIKYSDTVPLPPYGQDAVDHLLFEGKQGYCDYYASGMAVMLRSLSIPARVVSGYATGMPDPEFDFYVVKDSDAHSWPEVYFPEYGWVPFEPTASRPIIYRPELPVKQDDTKLDTPDEEEGTPAEELLEDDAATPGDGASDGFSIPAAAAKGLGGLAVLLALATVVLLVLWRYGLRGLSSSDLVYAKVERLAGWLGFGQQPHQTPFEYSEGLAELSPRNRNRFRTIAEAFVRRRFGRKGLTEEEEQGLAAQWRELRNEYLRALSWERIRRALGRNG